MLKILALSFALLSSVRGMLTPGGHDYTTLLTSVQSDVPALSGLQQAHHGRNAMQLPAIKKWAPDFHAEEHEAEMRLLLTRGFSPNMEELLEEVLIDDGHDEQSHDDMNRGVQPCCSCCSCCSTMNSSGSAQPKFNSAIDDMLLRLAEFSAAESEPIPISLRRRSPQEMALLMTNQRSHYLHHWGVLNFEKLRTLLNVPTAFMTARSQRHQARAMKDESKELKSIHTEGAIHKKGRRGKAVLLPVGFSLPAVGDGIPTRARGDVCGCHNLTRTGDVVAASLHGGSTMLKIPIETGPVKLRIARDTKTASQATVDQLRGELQLTLHPKTGLQVHSLRFDKPTSFVSSTVPIEEVSSRRMPLASPSDQQEVGFTAVAAQILRRSLREILAQ